MAAEDAVHDGQAYAGAFEFRCRVEPLKRVEQFICMGHVKTGAVVAHEVNRLAVSLRHPDLNLRHGPVLRELPGIAQQVVERNAEQVGIALNEQIGSHLALDPTIG